MRDQLYYEWVIEMVDTDDDIMESNSYDTYAEVLRHSKYSLDEGCHYEIALTRCLGNDDDGLKHREYAYLVNGALPDEFNKGSRVPQRFADEIKRNA